MLEQYLLVGCRNVNYRSLNASLQLQDHLSTHLVHLQRRKYASWFEIDGRLQRGNMKHQES